LSLLAWYVYAPQCLSTLAVIRRETGTWRYPMLVTAGMLAAAYIAAGITYHVARACLGTG
jgi:ferrous iron transport protein B